jgi:hypothetical protein
MFHEYPKWLYPEGAAPVLVQNAEQESAVMPKVETKAYSDGTTATGPTPLPVESPAASEPATQPKRRKA